MDFRVRPDPVWLERLAYFSIGIVRRVKGVHDVYHVSVMVVELLVAEIQGISY